MILRVSRCLYSRPSKALFSFSQFRPQIVQLLAFLPNNGQKAAKLNPGRTKRRLTRLAGGAKRAKEKRAWQGQRGNALDREGKNGRRQITGKGEVRLGRGAKQAKEKQAWQGGRAGSKLDRGAKQARGKLGRGGQSSMSDDLLSRLTAETWATKKMKPERKAPAFERNPDRLRALGNPLRFSRTLANYETVNLAKIVISVLQYIHCRTVENFTRLNISCNSFIKRTRRLNTLFIGFELAL